LGSGYKKWALDVGQVGNPDLVSHFNARKLL
jgi:hypothetical protein